MNTIYDGTFTIGQTSATNFVAGQGIKIDSPSAGTVRIGNDETVLWEGTLQTTAQSATLNYNRRDYKSLKFYCYPGNAPLQRAGLIYEVDCETLSNTGSFFAYLPVFNIASNSCTAEVLYVTGSENGNSIGLIGGTRSVNFGTATTGVTSYNASIKKIVGCNNVSGGNE